MRGLRGLLGLRGLRYLRDRDLRDRPATNQTFSDPEHLVSLKIVMVIGICDLLVTGTHCDLFVDLF